MRCLLRRRPNWRLKHPDGLQQRWAPVAADKKAQHLQIGAEDFGVVDRGVGEAKEVEGWGILVGVDVDQVEEEEEEVEMPVLILWHVTGVGCVAIWPVTAPNPVVSRREVALLALPGEHSPNPGKKAQGDVAEVARCDLGALMCCMMRTGIPIPWMMQANCTSPSNLHQILAMVRLRRKNKIKQKTKKDICQCGLCWCHM